MLTFHRGIPLPVFLFFALSLTATASAQPSTDSRLTGQDSKASAPITVIDRAQLEAMGLLSLEEALRNLTEHRGIVRGLYDTGPDGSPQMNLRGPEASRTLVLLNGRRFLAGALGSETAVDLSSLPITAIERIEILETGASALYGSGAIAGVVNIITRESSSGGEVRLLTGSGNPLNGMGYDLSLATGQSAERGGILFTAGYSDGLSFKSMSAAGAPLGPWVRAPRQVMLYSNGDFRLAGTSSAFFEASYAQRQWFQQASGSLSVAEDLIISADNLYNPSGVPVRASERRGLGLGPFEATQELTTFRLVAGLGGKLPERFGPLNGFTWELAYNHARTQGTLAQQGLLQRSRVSAALGPSFIDPATGEATCGAPLAPIEDCVPLNLFGGQEGITSEMAESVLFEGISRGALRQTSVTAHLAGPLFKLTPDASAASLTVGYEHRRQASAYIPDPLAAKGDTLWLTEAAGEGRYYVNEAYAGLSVPVLGTTDPVKGTSRDMLEVTGAARVFRYNTFGTDFAYMLGTRLGVIPDVTVRAAHSRDFRAPTAAAVSQGQLSTVRRVSDACSASSPGGLRMQGTQVDAVCDAQGVPDDLYDARVQQQVLVGGNPALEPETANNFTVGLVLAPRFLDSFSASVDYSRVQVDRAIVRVGEALLLNECYPVEGGGPVFCDTIERNEQGLISAIRAPLTNEATDVRSGVDLSMRYRPLTPMGLFDFSVDASWLLKAHLSVADGSPPQDNPLAYRVDNRNGWRARVGVSWARGGLGISARLHFVNGFKACSANACTLQEEGGPGPASRPVSDYYAADVNVAYAWVLKAGTATAQLGSTNVFDTKPAFIANTFTGISDPTLYSYRGRHFYLRLSYSYD